MLIGKIITVNIVTQSAASLANGTILASGIPVGYRPAVTVNYPIQLLNNTANTSGIVSVQGASGTLLFSVGFDGSLFSASGSCGWVGITISWLLP